MGSAIEIRPSRYLRALYLFIPIAALLAIANSSPGGIVRAGITSVILVQALLVWRSYRQQGLQALRYLQPGSDIWRYSFHPAGKARQLLPCQLPETLYWSQYLLILRLRISEANAASCVLLIIAPDSLTVRDDHRLRVALQRLQRERANYVAG